MGLSIEWLLEFIDAKEETEEYDWTETTWGVFKAYAFFFVISGSVCPTSKSVRKYLYLMSSSLLTHAQRRDSTP